MITALGPGGGEELDLVQTPYRLVLVGKYTSVNTKFTHYSLGVASKILFRITYFLDLSFFAFAFHLKAMILILLDVNFCYQNKFATTPRKYITRYLLI